MKEIQRFLITPTNIREQSAITINNPDGGTITVGFYLPKDNSPWTSSAFSTNATASQVQSAIQYFWNYNYGAQISVVRTMWDSNGVVTTDVLQSVKTQYVISVNLALSSPSFSFSVTPTKVTAGSGVTVAITIPKNLQLSSAPLSGSFTIQCTIAGGQASLTSNAATWSIKSAIENACP